MGFDKLSPVYNGLSKLVFGKQLINAQNYFINGIKDCSSILVVGGGPGNCLSEIIKACPLSTITFLDISLGMISKAKEYIKQNHNDHIENIKFVHGTYEQLPEDESYQVIISPFVLDCLNDQELRKTLSALYVKLKNDGLWLFTDFNIPLKPIFFKLFSKGIVFFLYSFFNLFCSFGRYQLPDFNLHFSHFFLQSQETRFFLNGLLVTKRYKKSA